MTLRPGSITWLLRHELRLFYFSMARQTTKGKQRSALGRGTVVGLLLLWSALHGLAYLVLVAAPPLPVGPMVFAVATILLLTVFAFMLSSALKASVDALFARGDMDLLLSSPLPSKPVFVARLAGIVIGISAIYLFFAAPFAHVGLALAQLHWLALYPVLFAMAGVTASASMVLTLLLVRAIGPRKTRIAAQILSAVAGAGIVLASQVYNVAGDETKEAIKAWLDHSPAVTNPASPLWLPARAALGEAGPLAAFAGVAIFAVAATVVMSHRFFMAGVLDAAGSASHRKVRAASAPRRFRSGLLWLTIAKEWKLIRRDPHLISQVLLQLFYLLPGIAAIVAHDDIVLPMAGAALTLLACSLAASLAWITVYAEDARDLLLSSPAKARTLRQAKVLAAALPALALPAVPLAWMMSRDIVAGVLLLLAMAGAVTCSIRVVHWVRRPGARQSFASRGMHDIKGNLLEVFSSFAWAAVAFLLGYSLTPGNEPPEAATVAAVVASPGLALLCAWCLRHRDA